jgi:hypothetical protein
MASQSHPHAPHATAAAPTISLLRLSAGARLIGAVVLAGVLWALVLVTIGST